MKKGTNTDFVAGLLGLGITAVFWFSLEDISLLSIIFPKAMVMIMALISVGLLVSAFVSPSRHQIFAAGDHKRVVVTGITLFAWIIAISWVHRYRGRT